MHLTALRALGDDVPVEPEARRRGLRGAGHRRARGVRRRRTPTCSAPTRSWSATPATPRSATRRATVSLRGMVNVVVTVEALASRGALRHVRRRRPRRARRAGRDAGHACATQHGQHHDRRAGQHPDAGRARPTRPSSSARTPACSTGVSLLGDGTRRRTCSGRARRSPILGIDCPPVVGSAAAIVPQRGARGSTCASRPGMAPERRPSRPDRAPARRRALGRARSPSRSRRPAPRSEAATDGPAYQAHGRGDARGLRHDRWRTLGQGGSIPLCNVFAETYPDAEIILMGVEEPLAPDPRAQRERRPDARSQHMALTEALFLQRYAAASS